MASRTAKGTADIKISKVGSDGPPTLEVLVSENLPINQVTSALQKNVTRNVDLRRRFGLGACTACISGFDISIRQRFEEVLKVNL